jgi:hypothetical protein
MGETLTQRRRVGDEGFRVVKPCQEGRIVRVLISSSLTVPLKEDPANSVPAAAVIRRDRALLGITGRKGRVGGLVCRA